MPLFWSFSCLEQQFEGVGAAATVRREEVTATVTSNIDPLTVFRQELLLPPAGMSPLGHKGNTQGLIFLWHPCTLPLNFLSWVQFCEPDSDLCPWPLHTPHPSSSGTDLGLFHMRPLLPEVSPAFPWSLCDPAISCFL